MSIPSINEIALAYNIPLELATDLYYGMRLREDFRMALEAICKAKRLKDAIQIATSVLNY